MKRSTYFLSVLVLSFSCKPEKSEKDTLFTLVSPTATGIHFANQLTENEQFNIIEYLYFNNGAGVAAGDINNDGLIDLYFSASQRPNKLYLNKGDLVFEDITLKAGVAGTGDWKTGVTMADVNGDGFLDIYVCQVAGYKGLRGRNQLFINQGNLTFSEEASAYGLDFEGFSTQSAFFDHDGDGDLDCYLLNHSVHSTRSYGHANLRLEDDPRAGDRLFRNDEADGKRVFHDVTKESGIYSSHIGYGLGVNISDLSNDGFPDIYISNDFHENDYLYINQGNGTFSERLTEMIEHTSRSSMGNDVGDFNNDGWLDILVLDMLPDEEKIRKKSGGEDDYELTEIKREYGYDYQFVRNTLQLNLGGGLFSEIGQLAGIYTTDWSWSPLFCDVDNDGWKDLFITNGIYRRANDLDYVRFLTGGNRYFPEQNNRNVADKVLYEKMPLYPHINFIFRNNGDLTFTNMAETWGFNTRSYSNGATYADLDNDGDLDLITNNINEPAYILRNNAEKNPENHYLEIQFQGRGLNRRGTGARVTVFCDGQQQVAEQFATRGFMSATSDRLHFGLGRATMVDSVEVRWPDRTVQILKDIPADQMLVLDISHAADPLRKPEMNHSGQQFFEPVSITGLAYRHREDAYTDLLRERLIPHSLSTEGPALAIGDVNSDGLDDVFIGGARGQEAGLFLQRPDGLFRPVIIPVLQKERFTEDVDAALFDADGDGDLDLYVMRGGNEFPAGTAGLVDRLLINDGTGAFHQPEKGAMPYIAQNGSCVRPGDFDGDGDMDLLVCSRSVPGAYGLSPEQYLLENDGRGYFRDVTDIRMKGFKKAGMVTDACWTDVDGDGDLDLAVVGEWMRLCLWRNDRGEFTEVTEAAGLGETSGWWFGITAADVDNDGDVDLIGGNLGLNTMLKASIKEPVEMYLNDFDNNGMLDQIICSYQQGVSYPVASLDELAGQIKGFANRFPRYEDFAGKTLLELVGRNTLEQSVVKRAELFESCLFLNSGTGAFTPQKLPVVAQFSPVRDIIARDVDQDGLTDLILAGNFYAIRPSLGRYDASYGWCLLGTRDGGFRALMPLESGLAIRGDVRRTETIAISGRQYLVAAVNGGELQVFRLKQ